MGQFWESFAAARLIKRVARAKVETDDGVARVAESIVSLTNLVCRTPDAGVRSEALRVLAEKWEGSGPAFQALVLMGFRNATAVDLPLTGQRLFNVPVAVTGFVVPRVVGYLGWALAQDHRLPERFEAFSTPFPVAREVAYWLVGAALESTDERALGDLAGLLAGTSDRALLDALEGRLRDAVLSRRDDQLWRDGDPTPLTWLLRANPHLPTPPRVVSGGRLWDEASVLIAVLQERADRVRAFLGPRHGAGAVNALVAGASMPAPSRFVAACRHLLRDLPPGEPREVLCRMALFAPSSEALAAVADAGYLPASERDGLAFLFSTSQWELYDRADPTGELLREYCETYATTYDGDSYRRFLEEAAERGGRPNPCPPVPKFTPGRHGAIGSWPTDPGSGGGFDGGGGFGGSY